jgi:hypothetical protein
MAGSSHPIRADGHGKKSPQYFSGNSWLRKGDPNMRKSVAILLGSVAALAILSAPVVAKSSRAQKADDKPAASECSAYEQALDGSWRPLPCQEIDSGGQTHQRSTPRGGDDAKD